jgi:hypothetical protein
LLILVCIAGFPTTLLAQAREKIAHDPNHRNSDSIDYIDKWTFWLFIAGIWKDPRKDVMWNFYGVVIVIAMCLLIERISMTWLFTRNGCTYPRFQKFVELDLRYQAVKNEVWPEIPRYNPHRYRNHYFEQDFDELLAKFTETDE